MKINVRYPNKVSLANTPTALVPLDRLSSKLNGPRIWLKNDDETGFLLSGNKVRKLEYLLAEAKEEKADTVITCGGVQSNHCRATAIAAKKLGFDATLVLKEDNYIRSLEPNSDGNLLLDELCGASVNIYPSKQYLKELDKLLEKHRLKLIQEGASPYVIPTGGSNATGLWGYISATEELLIQYSELGFVPESIYCATGSAGTQSGLTVGSYLSGVETQVVGIAVCDSKEYFLNKILNDVDQWQNKYQSYIDTHTCISKQLSICTLDEYIGPGYARPYPEMLKQLQELAALEGVVLDPVYTGKAFHGMVEEIKKGNLNHINNVVFIHTGGTFGGFPFKSLLSSQN